MDRDTFENTMKNLGYEYYIDCSGYKFTGPRRFLQEGMSECIDPRTGQIQVNQFCQVTQKHPLLKQSDASKDKTYDNIFAIGDVAITPSNEPKTIVSIHQYKEIVANNIVQQLKGTKSKSEFQKLPETFTEIGSIPIGTKMGLLMINDMVIMHPAAVNVKTTIETDYLDFMRNNENAEIKEDIKNTVIGLSTNILK